MVWDCPLTGSFADEVQYFAALDFAVPVDTIMMRTLPVNILSSWLVQMDSTLLVESVSAPEEVMGSLAPPHISLMVVMEEKYMYGEEPSFVPTVGVGLVYKPPYVRAMNFSRAVDILEYSLAPTEEEDRITSPLVFFINVAPLSLVRPLAEPYPLWIDYSLQCHLEYETELWSTSCLRGFQLHRVVSIPMANARKKVYVSLPNAAEFDHIFSLALSEEVPSEMETTATQPLYLCPPSPTHWAIAMDADFLTHLENRATEWAAQTKGNKGKGKARPKVMPHSARKIDPPKRTIQGPPQKMGPSSRTRKKSTNTQGGSSEWPVACLMGDANLLGDTELNEDQAGLIPSDLLDPSPLGGDDSC